MRWDDLLDLGEHFLGCQGFEAGEMLGTVASSPRLLPAGWFTWQAFGNGEHVLGWDDFTLWARDAKDAKRRNAQCHA